MLDPTVSVVEIWPCQYSQYVSEWFPDFILSTAAFLLWSYPTVVVWSSDAEHKTPTITCFTVQYFKIECYHILYII